MIFCPPPEGGLDLISNRHRELSSWPLQGPPAGPDWNQALFLCRHFEKTDLPPFATDHLAMSFADELDMNSMVISLASQLRFSIVQILVFWLSPVRFISTEDTVML